MSPVPEVSVVIPTRGRPELVTRAARSALAQTGCHLEVVVVVDGRDEATAAALAAVGDARLRVITLDAPGGAPNARNTGVGEARAPWTALLDDDDEWYPDKLAVQLGLARNAAVPTPIVTCRLVNRTPRAEFVLPRRLPAPDEPISEYLTVRRGPFHGDGFIQTSTIFAPTELLQRVPFTVGLRRFQELDWALRALDHADVGLVVADEPLVVWHADENRPRISLDTRWEDSVAWLERSRPLLTRRAYSALAMSVISSAAAASRSPKVAASLLRDARRHGDPRAVDYLTFLQIWLVPSQLRRNIRDRVLGRGRTGGATGGAAATPGIPATRVSVR